MRRTAAVAAVAVTTLAFSSPALAAVPDLAVESGTLICYVSLGDQIMLLPVPEGTVCPAVAP